MTVAIPPSGTAPSSDGLPAAPAPSDDGFWVEPGAAGETAQGPAETAPEPVAAEAAQGPAEATAPDPVADESEQGPTEAEASSEPAEAEVAEVVLRDAHEFGVYARTGGWAFALKVARSVRPGGQAQGETVKVSAKRFAELAGCSAERIMRYYKAWDKAADDGLVPHFEILVPGQEIDLPDSDAWLSYYSARSSASSERGTAITAAAEAEGIRPTKALEVAENPTALRAAILADPATARTARAALLDRLREDPALGTELARDVARTDELKKAVAAESRVADRIGYVRGIVEGGQVRTPAGQTIDAPAELRAEAERRLSLIDELDDDEEAGTWAAEAYDTVKELVVQAVEADPELRREERRTKFYSSLQRATKVFEDLTLDDADDLDDLYEDDMLHQLEELQKAIGTCITALRQAAPAPEQA
ncbi:hypothetical protein ACIHAA_04185 [Streptomyces sp. NPDC052040]|uniref:hypothetical protein n=1 Tax=Streptomyces sp. NPDC052040 TaxID=3365682 RepID=UPI0037D6F46A